MITVDQAQSVIQKMNKSFDSHKFIEQFSIDYEADYVRMLCKHKDSDNGIFKTVHARIARFLSNKATALNILKTDRTSSENIKGYESENQEWEKL
jgi:hypothetical protein